MLSSHLTLLAAFIGAMCTFGCMVVAMENGMLPPDHATRVLLTGRT